ncbi:hypothetical protein CALVIDRAFT_96307 [Calocera viscosa TUFC12733]|uniref:Uncharacterized protein n=1 Tax=Calocera viscosa (strain TUFC12733) TaxID=1330018 RepID=A0A167MYA1_CALVF|nr:hypothetical protein CALVIDRAFT_96307 [Calocera viscosa TUFC12733]
MLRNARHGAGAWDKSCLHTGREAGGRGHPGETNLRRAADCRHQSTSELHESDPSGGCRRAPVLENRPSDREGRRSSRGDPTTMSAIELPLWNDQACYRHEGAGCQHQPPFQTVVEIGRRRVTGRRGHLTDWPLLRRTRGRHRRLPDREVSEDATGAG